ncbi:hypothetical protein N2152v2_001158 [Parachlorella kessleri]
MLHLASLLTTGAPWRQGAQQLHHTATPDDAADAFFTAEPSSMSSTTNLWLPGSPLSSGRPLGEQERSLHLQNPATLATLVAFRRTLGSLSGIVIDSAPSQATPAIWSRGVLSAALGQPAAGIEEAHPVAVRALRSLVGPYLRAKPIARRYTEIQQAWLESPLCPQLYLYSEADTLIPQEDVRFWMQKQASGVML